MRLTYLQFWIIAACLFIILASALFFWSYKNSSLDKMNLTKDYTDSLFIKKYNPTGNPISVKPAQPADNIPVAVKADSIRTAEKPDTKVETPVKPAELTNLPKEKKKPIQLNRRYEDYVDDRDVPGDQSHDYYDRGAGDYSLSNDEIQALLAGYNREENSDNSADNLSQVQRAAGGRAFNDYVRKNRHSLTDPDCANQHGKVILLFKVDTGGHPVDITVFRSLCQAADQEAVRLLKNGPVWPASGDNFTRWEVTF